MMSYSKNNKKIGHKIKLINTNNFHWLNKKEVQTSTNFLNLKIKRFTPQH